MGLQNTRNLAVLSRRQKKSVQPFGTPKRFVHLLKMERMIPSNVIIVGRGPTRNFEVEKVIPAFSDAAGAKKSIVSACGELNEFIFFALL